MPLPSDQQIVKTSQELVETLQGAFGKHAGMRPAHAKGLLFTGTFTPTETASALSIAPHFTSPNTPLLVRFSNSTGIPQIPDNDPNADPRGIAIRFDLGSRKHTDIIAHSTPFFPTRTGTEFLEFFRAIGASGPDVPSPKPVEVFLGSHPKALAFVQAPKPAPSSFARQEYFSVSAFKLIDAKGNTTFVRYRVVPKLGVETLSAEVLKEKSQIFLLDEIVERVKKGPVLFSLQAQVAAEGDITDDATEHWPEERQVVVLGEVKVEGTIEAEENAKMQKQVIFDPIPRVQGVEPSDDPLLEVRAAVYLISGKERRAA
ncbi:heme-dependent catalase [Gymnopus androsaceus JB14]|uniref:Heme-dependent catalase n=1 Tax=Gymnopus androsaceus JB14 TaxID=1447944 RepID=A0A6A4GSB3_9AGAR|nr:heme-dependent catalase [Gymnopus androsaceus JB14]